MQEIHKARIGSQVGKNWKSSWVSFAKLGCSCVSGIAEFLLVVMAFFVCLSLFSHGLKTGWSGGGGVIIEGGLIIGIWTCRWLVGFVQGSPIRNPWFQKNPPGEGGVINEGGLTNQS